jgi:hypothetical protein
VTVSRRELLGLVQRAPGPLRTIEAALTRWVDVALVPAAQGDGVDAGDGEKPDGPAAPGSGHPEEALSYVVVALPDRWRVVGRGHIAVSDGHQSWVGTGSLVTERSSTRAALHDAGPIGACLYPGPLLDWLELGDPEPDERSGCFCWAVDARLHLRRVDDGPGIDATLAAGRLASEFPGVEHRFWFEARTGIVLRHEGWLDGGKPCSLTELTDVVIDEPIPAPEFAPPPEAIVRPSHELLRDHLAGLGVDPDSLDLDDPEQVRRALRQEV